MPRFIILLFACAGCALSHPLTTPAREEVAALDTTHGALLAHFRIGETTPVWAIVDTGAQGAVLTEEYARAQSLPNEGADEVSSPLGGESIHGFHTTIGNGYVGDVRTSRFTATVVPMDLGTPQAILGPDVFVGRLVTIDITGARLLVSERGPREPAGISSSYAADNLPTIAVSAAGHVYAAHLDTGSDSPISMNLALAHELPLAAPPQKTGEGQSVTARFDIYSAQLVGDMTVGPITLHNPTIEFFDTPNARVNVGRDTLARMLITIDPQRKRVWAVAR